MKYKLKKNINGAEAGTEFKYNKESELYWVDLINWKSVWNILDLIRAIWIDNEDYFEKIDEKPKSIYDLKEWCFYTISPNHEISSHYIKLWCLLEKRISIWDAFLTKEEAEKELSKRKALAKIKKWSWENDNGYEFIFEWINYFIQWDLIRGECEGEEEIQLIIDEEYSYKNYATQYYSSEKIAKEALIELQNEYHILFD